MKIGKILAVCSMVATSLLLIAEPAVAGGGGGGGLCPGFSAGPELIMRDSCFDGVAHFAAAGTTLVVENRGIIPHSFTAVDGSFDTGLLQPGENSRIHLGDDGVVRVLCTLHGTVHGDGMAGVLLIGDPNLHVVPDLSPLEVVPGDHKAGTPDELKMQSQMVSRMEDGPREVQVTPRISTMAVAATGGLLGMLLIAVVRRTQRRAADVEGGRSPDALRETD